MERRATKMMPVAMMLVVTGMMILLAGNVGPRLVHKAVGSDFARGPMEGVGIGLACVGVALAVATARRALGSKKDL